MARSASARSRSGEISVTRGDVVAMGAAPMSRPWMRAAHRRTEGGLGGNWRRRRGAGAQLSRMRCQRDGALVYGTLRRHMCGIAGILGRVDDTQPGGAAADERRAGRTAARTTRGPGNRRPGADGQGALLGLPPPGHPRPLARRATSRWWTRRPGRSSIFNGEIYNFQALRDRLRQRANSFRSTGDTEVLLRALAHRAGTARRWPLRGDVRLRALGPGPAHAAARARPAGHQAALRRDRGTIRGRGWTLAFASEVRALLASGLLGTPRLDPRRRGLGGLERLRGRPADGGGGRGARSCRASCACYDDAGTRGAAAGLLAPARRRGRGACPSTRRSSPRRSRSRVRLHLTSRRAAGRLPLRRHRLLGGGQPGAAGGPRTGPHLHPGLRGGGVQRGARRPGASPRPSAPSTRRCCSPRRTFVGELERGAGQPRPAHLRRAQLLSTCRTPCGRPASPWRWWGRAGDELFGGYTSFRDLPALHRLVAAASAALPRAALAEAAAAGAGRPCTARAAPSRARRGGQSSRRWCAGETTWSRSTSWPTRSSSRTSRRSCSPPGHLALVDGLPRAPRARLERRAPGPLATCRRSACSSSGSSSASGCFATTTRRAWPPRSSSGCRWWTRCCWSTWCGCPDEPRYQPIRRKAALRRIGLRGLDPALFERPKRGFVLPFDRWIRQGLSAAIDSTLRDSDAVRAAGLEPEAVAPAVAGFPRRRARPLLVAGVGALRAGALVPAPRSPSVSGRRYVLITPCRDEARYARRTLDAVLGQTRSRRRCG